MATAIYKEYRGGGGGGIQTELRNCTQYIKTGGGGMVLNRISMAEEIGACAMAVTVVNKQCSDHAVFVHLYIRTSILHTSTILLY